MEKDYNKNLVYIEEDTRQSLERYAEAERKRGQVTMPELITWKSLANHILKNEVQKRGHYVGKKPGLGDTADGRADDQGQGGVRR